MQSACHSILLGVLYYPTPPPSGIYDIFTVATVLHMHMSNWDPSGWRRSRLASVRCSLLRLPTVLRLPAQQHIVSQHSVGITHCPQTQADHAPRHMLISLSQMACDLLSVPRAPLRGKWLHRAEHMQRVRCCKHCWAAIQTMPTPAATKQGTSSQATAALTWRGGAWLRGAQALQPSEQPVPRWPAHAAPGPAARHRSTAPCMHEQQSPTSSQAANASARQHMRTLP